MCSFTLYLIKSVKKCFLELFSELDYLFQKLKYNVFFDVTLRGIPCKRLTMTMTITMSMTMIFLSSSIYVILIIAMTRQWFFLSPPVLATKTMTITNCNVNDNAIAMTMTYLSPPFSGYFDDDEHRISFDVFQSRWKCHQSPSSRQSRSQQLQSFNMEPK